MRLAFALVKKQTFYQFPQATETLVK